MKTASQIKKSISDNSLDSLLLDIYPDSGALDYQKDRYIRAIDSFLKAYDRNEDTEISIFSAPGRTEIGGNHTDHQNGKVLAAAITDDAIAVVTPLSDSKNVRVLSQGFDMITIDITDIGKIQSEEGTTTALIKGVLYRLKRLGYAIGSFDAYITSDVLQGSGLSSSAAFENLIGTIISGLYNDMKITPQEIAATGQFSENKYFGKPCGLMDQMASSMGSMCFINFRDPDDVITKSIDCDLSKYGYSLCITDTKGSHADLTPDYAAVPAEMKAVAAVFDANLLCDVDEEVVMANIGKIRQKAGDRALLRALHYYEENKRVDQEVKALSEGDMEGFLSAFRQSAKSSFQYLQNVYTPKDPSHQNTSIALMISDMIIGDDGAARIHGGGFAGTIQAIIKSEKVDEYRKKMDEVFGDGSCKIYSIRKYGGIKVI
ncbi:MAG: galactokinase [Lachnospiraceae bacterium]|nr:galactokinase [Lachnospiraceae bacterium]